VSPAETETIPSDVTPAAARAAAPRHAWRSGLESVVMAVVMALFLKQFVLETYRIPTGSMQPTLIGDQAADVQDRILVDRLSYALRAPRRWEVAVFRYPLDRSKSFVKRIAGIGPEELRFEHGDVWTRRADEDWRIARRPREVMRSHWKRLDALAPEVSAWIPSDLPRSSSFEAEGRAVRARGRGTVAFRGGREPIRDEYLDGYPEALLEHLSPHVGDSGRNLVGDLRLEGRVRALAGCERVTVVLSEGVRRYRFELAGPAAPSAARTRIDAGPSARAGANGVARPESPYRLPAGRAVHIAAENLDDRLVLELDGEELLALEIEPAEDQAASLALELEGEGADLDELMAYRDVYYETRTAPIAVPAGCYYMLGDNTQDSSDSREWTFVVFERLADGVRVRGGWRERENPLVVGHGAEGGPLTRLVDEWGEMHWFARDEARRATPELAPFVPRELVQGKALAVFWPIAPLRGIWRPKWVN
jgi:signal peptidase I